MVILVQNFWCFGSVVTYGRWSFTRCSEYGNLSWKLLVSWIGGHLWEVVAYEMWSFTRFSEYGNLRWKMFGVLNRWSIMGGGHLRDVPSMVI